jgi:hypothetical protein
MMRRTLAHYPKRKGQPGFLRRVFADVNLFGNCKNPGELAHGRVDVPSWPWCGMLLA